MSKTPQFNTKKLDTGVRVAPIDTNMELPVLSDDEFSPTTQARLDEEENIYVITRTGKRELLDTNKITERMRRLVRKKPYIHRVNAHEVMLNISSSISSGISTYEIDEHSANTCASMSIDNPYYAKLAARIAIDNHQKNTKRSFIDKMKEAYLRKDKSGKITSLISSDFYKFVEKHQDAIEPMIQYKRDFLMDFFGFRTFQRLYAIKINGKIIERPQDMFMRAAVALHMDNETTDIDKVLFLIKETYDALSLMRYTQASPMYFNAGTKHPQFSSCFLLGTEDSLEGIKGTEYDMAKISKWSGGIGVHVHCWRGAGSLIRGTNGTSSGIVPFLRMYNATMRAFNQGGKRMGSAAIYLMPHHPDVQEFINLKRPDGADEERARDLFYAGWLPDIFMKRVKSNGIWSLFDPDVCGDLSNYYDEVGDEKLTRRYIQLEQSGYATKTVRARDIWDQLFETNVQKGIPYMCSHDNANRQNSQKHLGVIKSSNLCAEIYEYSDSKESAVCNLCSINLESCVKDSHNETELKQPEEDRRKLNHEFPDNPWFDFEQLLTSARLAVRNLNNVIDRNYYPTEKTYRSNIRHRPIGVGIQGQANAYIKMRYPFESDEARELNKRIYETLMFGCYSESTKMCREIWKNAVSECKNKGSYDYIEYSPAPEYKEEKKSYTVPEQIPKTIGAYPSMYWNGGSPLTKGLFCWRLAGKDESYLSGMYDWETLEAHIKTFGMRNSLLNALMPTASTSQLLGNNECFEPFTSNIYKRKTLVGENIVINKYLINDMFELNIWSPQMKQYLLHFEGSIQAIDGIPQDLKDLYKTAWEIPQEELVRQAIERQPFIDQGQSLNLYMENMKKSKFTKLMFQGWEGGLKTLKYYGHSRPSSMPQKFTIDHAKQMNMNKILAQKQRSTAFLGSLRDDCVVCSG